MKHSVEEITLDNGAKGLLIQVPNVDVVNFLVEFRAGFDLGDFEKYELPHVMEHLMFTNETYPEPREFHREVEKNGAYSNAYTTIYSLGYVYECAAFEAERIAELLGIQVKEPTFPKQELNTELGNVREELSNYISNHRQFTVNNLVTNLEERPDYNQRIEQLATIERNDLTEFYQRTHTGGNMRFIVIGDIENSLLDNLDIELDKGDRLKIPEVKSKPLQEPVVATRNITQTYYTVLSRFPKRLSYRELIAARIITNLLSEGFSSTLFGEARERGLVYGLSMGISRRFDDSSFYLYGFVTPDNSDEYFDLAREKIKEVQNGEFSQAKFEATKQLLRGKHAQSYQQVSHLSRFYRNYFQTDEVIHFNRFDQLMEEISKQEAVEIFNKFFQGSNWGVSLTGPIDQDRGEELRGKLAGLWID